MIFRKQIITDEIYLLHTCFAPKRTISRTSKCKTLHTYVISSICQRDKIIKMMQIHDYVISYVYWSIIILYAHVDFAITFA